jgi:hypothetical protein
MIGSPAAVAYFVTVELKSSDCHCTSLLRDTLEKLVPFISLLHARFKMLDLVTCACPTWINIKCSQLNFWALKDALYIFEKIGKQNNKFVISWSLGVVGWNVVIFALSLDILRIFCFLFFFFKFSTETRWFVREVDQSVGK